MIKTITLAFFIFNILVVPGFASESNKYSIKTMTPQVQEALDSRKSRFSKLHEFKENGTVGENNRGYVQVLKKDQQAEEIVRDENKDRKVIYKTIAEQNDLEGQISIIEAAFATIQRERASEGEKVQTESGDWIAKQ